MEPTRRTGEGSEDVGRKTVPEDSGGKGSPKEGRKLDRIKGLRKYRTLSIGKRVAIKRILGMSPKQPFMRCPAKSWGRARKLAEEKGEWWHLEKRHICDECRCRFTAGYGTRGDFYGLGEETGHFGVGHCRVHENKCDGEKYARNSLRDLQSYGRAELRGADYEHKLEVEAREAKEFQQFREGCDLVVSELNKFRQMTESKTLTEYRGNQLLPISDVTRVKMALDIANTIARLTKDSVSLDSSMYIHFDELRERFPKQIALGKRLFLKLKELLSSYKEGQPDPVKVVEEEWVEGHKQIWKDAKVGRTK